MTFSFSRAAATAAAALGVLLAAPAVAQADARYLHSDARSGAHGASLHIRVAHADRHGRVYFVDTYYRAGPDGATVHRTYSRAR